MLLSIFLAHSATMIVTNNRFKLHFMYSSKFIRECRSISLLISYYGSANIPLWEPNKGQGSYCNAHVEVLEWSNLMPYSSSVI